MPLVGDKVLPKTVPDVAPLAAPDVAPDSAVLHKNNDTTVISQAINPLGKPTIVIHDIK